MVEKLSRRERFRGVILGTAVGDALGSLPRESHADALRSFLKAAGGTGW